eukprot:TRINITY_DN30280_c0_g1_i1.p2 TRINITY_DN30280_c0_g1~~TRINITY_DN30280_c0_g1_i1.p2  ORF type:complete len:489 (+),score=131.60 TRINITY_DN30280_c0_g1_i1:58-1524(+)
MPPARRRRRAVLLCAAAAGAGALCFAGEGWRVGTDGGRTGSAAGGGGTVSAAAESARRPPLPQPQPTGPRGGLRRLGDCYWAAPGGALCAEGRQLVLFSAERDGEQALELCLGYPQTPAGQKEGTVVNVHLRRRAPDDLRPAFGRRRVAMAKEYRPAFVFPLTLESNLFHVLRDTLAPLADLVDLLPEEVRARDQRVAVLTPRNPRLPRRGDGRYHFALAGLTGGGPLAPWRARVMSLGERAVDAPRVCFDTAYLGLPFRGYGAGEPMRIAAFTARVLRAMDAGPDASDGEWAAAQTRLRLLFIDRGPTQGGRANREVGNREQIAEGAEAAGFAVRSAAMHALPVRTQLLLASGADVVLGAHGQGLAWCAFLRPGKVCIELAIWRDPRPDFRHLCRWSGVHRLYVPLRRAAQVVFPNVSLSPRQVAAMVTTDYYLPPENQRLRQEQVIFPDLAEVGQKLQKAQQLLARPEGAPAGLELEAEPRQARRR